MQRVASLSVQTPRFDPRPVHVRFVMGRLAKYRIILRILLLFPVIVIPSMLQLVFILIHDTQACDLPNKAILCGISWSTGNRSAFTWLLVLKSLKLSEYDEYCLRMTITVSQHTEFSNRKWVGYAVSWENIALLTPRFPKTVGHVIAREVPRSRSNNTAILRLEAFSVAPQVDVAFLCNVGTCETSYMASRATTTASLAP
jgi:hypothetical protein